MILPTMANMSFQCSPKADNPARCTKGVDADIAWQALIANSFKNNFKINDTYVKYPAQVFVDYWEHAIRMYEQIFSASKLALILTPDDYQNMPEFTGTSLPLPSLNK